MIKLNEQIKISIITPTFNSEKNIIKNILSVNSQNYSKIEQIIIDNASNDKTIDIIKNNSNRSLKIISEEDKGTYDALNKGIKEASGHIISILHSDDFFYSQSTITDIADIFNNSEVDGVYGDLIYINKKNKPIRYWKSNTYVDGLFKLGWAPPHPSLFLKKSLFEAHGYFDISRGNSADFELMKRFFEKKKIKTKYVNKVFVVMRYGGQSNKNTSNILKQNYEIIKILGIQKDLIGLLRYFYFKITDRLIQLIFRNRYKK